MCWHNLTNQLKHRTPTITQHVLLGSAGAGQLIIVYDIITIMMMMMMMMIVITSIFNNWAQLSSATSMRKGVWTSVNMRVWTRKELRAKHDQRSCYLRPPIPWDPLIPPNIRPSGPRAVPFQHPARGNGTGWGAGCKGSMEPLWCAAAPLMISHIKKSLYRCLQRDAAFVHTPTHMRRLLVCCSQAPVASSSGPASITTTKDDYNSKELQELRRTKLQKTARRAPRTPMFLYKPNTPKHTNHSNSTNAHDNTERV